MQYELNQVYDIIEDSILKSTAYDNKVDGKVFTASSMGKNILQLYLEKKYSDKIIKPQLNSDLTFGSVTHKGLETIFNPIQNTVTELRMTINNFYKDYSLSGSADLIIESDDFISIIDWKVTKNYTVKNLSNESPYVKQLNILKFLYSQTINNEKPIKMFLGFWLKDSKKETNVPTFTLIEVENLNINMLISEINNKIDLFEHYLTENITPPECDEKWFVRIKGKAIPRRCKYYCSVKNICPYYQRTREGRNDIY